MTTKKNTKNTSANSVTLKRTVTIKAVVTEKFKEYMKFELSTAITKSKTRMQDIDSRIPDLKGKSGGEFLGQQLNAEKIQLQNSIVELERRLQESEKLELDTQFIQGTVDGFVSVAEGDNVYEKLGGMEIIAKDGVVEQIVPVAEIGIK
jgi:hypothetical protein